MRRGQGGTDILPRELRFAAKWPYELCFWFSMLDETGATRPPWLDSSLPQRPCRGISVLRSTILQPLSSFAMRSCGSMSVPPCPRRTSLTLWLNLVYIKRQGAVDCTSVFIPLFCCFVILLCFVVLLCFYYSSLLLG